MTLADSEQPFKLFELAVEKSPEVVALVTSQASFTYRELRDAAIAAATYLSSLELGQGDSYLYSGNQELLPPLILANWYLGLTLVSAAPGRADYDFASPKVHLTTVGVDEGSARLIRPDAFAVALRDNPRPEFRGYLKRESISQVFFTKGTTGTPKALGFPVHLMLPRAQAILEVAMKSPKHLSAFGLATMQGSNTFLAAMSKGTTYFLPGTPSYNAQLIANYQIRSLLGSPNQVSILLAGAESGDHTLSSLESVQVTGTAPDNTLRQRCSRLLGFGPDVQFGSSETGAVAVQFAGKHAENQIGQVMDWAEIAILDENEAHVAPFETGRLAIRSRNQIERYLSGEGPVSTGENGWFYPGDRGRMNDLGEITLLPRNDDRLNVGGQKFSKSSVEAWFTERLGVECVAASIAMKQGPTLAIFLEGKVADPEKVQKEFSSAHSAVPQLFLASIQKLPRNELGVVELDLLINKLLRL